MVKEKGKKRFIPSLIASLKRTEKARQLTPVSVQRWKGKRAKKPSRFPSVNGSYESEGQKKSEIKKKKWDEGEGAADISPRESLGWGIQTKVRTSGREVEGQKRQKKRWNPRYPVHVVLGGRNKKAIKTEKGRT